MKKILLLMAALMLFAPLSYADYDDYGQQRGNGCGHREHEHHHRQHYQQPEGRYYQQQPVYSQPVQYPSNELRLHW